MMGTKLSSFNRRKKTVFFKFIGKVAELYWCKALNRDIINFRGQ